MMSIHFFILPGKTKYGRPSTISTSPNRQNSNFTICRSLEFKPCSLIGYRFKQLYILLSPIPGLCHFFAQLCCDSVPQLRSGFPISIQPRDLIVSAPYRREKYNARIRYTHHSPGHHFCQHGVTTPKSSIPGFRT